MSKVKVKLGVVASPGFSAALRKMVEGNLPVRTAFKLKGVIKCVNDELAKYEEVRTSLLKKYGKKKEGGELELGDNNQVQFEPDQMQAFVKEFDELLATEVELPTIAVSELGEKLEISTSDLMAVESIVTE